MGTAYGPVGPVAQPLGQAQVPDSSCRGIRMFRTRQCWGSSVGLEYHTRRASLLLRYGQTEHGLVIQHQFVNDVLEQGARWGTTDDLGVVQGALQ